MGKIKKSFYDWCIENSQQDYLNLWDYDLNKCSPKEMSYQTHQFVYFHCAKHWWHKSKVVSLHNLIHSTLFCDECNSFGQWCLDNDKFEILNRWDYNLNKCSPFDILYSTHSKYYFRCPIGLHKSEQKDIGTYTRGEFGTMDCKVCNSFAQWGLNNIGQDFLIKYWDWEKNEELGINPWKITKETDKKVWIYCQKKSYHESYLISCVRFMKGNRCPYCHNLKVHRFDSLGWMFPEIFKYWSSKNTNSPYDYTLHSAKFVWWKCENHKHKDYYRDIHASYKYNFRCPDCVRERTESIIQEKVRLYIENQYSNYILNHEYNCTLVPINPKTTMLLPFDNEIIIEDKHLIIEVHGIQHYKISSYNSIWNRPDITPKQQLHYQKLKDRYKKYVAFCNGYFYLAIPCWDIENSEKYKEIIDNKIKIILNKDVINIDNRRIKKTT